MEKDPNYYSELKQLNEDLLKYIQDSIAECPFYDYSPTFKDYLEQFAALEAKFNNNESKPGTNILATPFTPSGTQSSQEPVLNNCAPPQPTFSFSAAASKPSFSFLAPSSGGSTFTANTPNKPSTTTAPSSGSLFSAPQTSFGTATTSLFSLTTPSVSTAFSLIPTPTTTATPSAALDTTTTTTTTTTKESTGDSKNESSVLKSLTGSFTSDKPVSFGAESFQKAQPFTFSFTMPKQDEQTQQSSLATTKNDDNQADDSQNKDGDEAQQPPEPKIDKYEEPNAKLAVKCKLYEKGRNVEGQSPFQLLGVGNLYVKDMGSPDKSQIIFRQEPDYRRVILNEVITPLIPIKLLPKAVQVVFPDPKTILGVRFYVFKMKDETDAKAIYNSLDLYGPTR